MRDEALFTGEQLAAGCFDSPPRSHLGRNPGLVSALFLFRDVTTSQDHVARLDVAVEDAAIMGVLDGVTQRNDELRRQAGRYRLRPRL